MKYVSIMDIIKTSHKMADAVKCMTFDHSINPDFGFWYAEKRLYVVKDERSGGIYFEEARSPYEAVQSVSERCKK